jgi:hypothetical protein
VTPRARRRDARRTKLLVAVVLLAVAVPATLAALAGAGAAYRWALRERAVDVALLASDAPDPAEVAARSRWTADDPGPRSLAPYQRDRIAADVLAAWAEVAYARRSGDGSGLPGRFRGPALDDARRALASAPAEVRDGVHTFTARFFAPDGGTVVIEDRHCSVQALATGDDGDTPFASERRVEMVLVADEGRWRVRDWRVLSVEGIAPDGCPTR